MCRFSLTEKDSAHKGKNNHVGRGVKIEINKGVKQKKKNTDTGSDLQEMHPIPFLAPQFYPAVDVEQQERDDDKGSSSAHFE